MGKAIYVILPAAITTLAKTGFFDDDDDEEGKKLSDWYRKTGKYKRYNYMTVPLGFTEDGKARGISIPMDASESLIWQLMMNASEDESMAQHLRDFGGSISNQLPSIESGIEVPTAWYNYLMNDINPFDDFTKRNVIADRNFQIGGWDATKDMVKWSGNKLGFKIPYYDESQKTKKDNILATAPILRRLYFETSIGDYEFLKDVKTEVAKERAIQLKKMDTTIYEVMKEKLDGIAEDDKGFRKVEFDAATIADVTDKAFKEYAGKDRAETPEDFNDFKTIRNKAKLAMHRNLAEGSVVANAIINAGSKKEKQEILEKSKKILSGPEYDDLVKFLSENFIMQAE
jgi:hypothetical protein